MDLKRLRELALEGLLAKKEAIEREIAALRKGASAAIRTIGEGRTRTAAGARVATLRIRKRAKRTLAQRKAQAAKMRAYWKERKAAEAKQTRRPRKAAKAKAAPVPF